MPGHRPFVRALHIAVSGAIVVIVSLGQRPPATAQAEETGGSRPGAFGASAVPNGPPPAPPAAPVTPPFDRFGPAHRAKLDPELALTVLRASLPPDVQRQLGVADDPGSADPARRRTDREVVHQQPVRREDRLRLTAIGSDRAAAEGAGLRVRAHIGDVMAGTIEAHRLDDLARLPSIQSLHAPAVSRPQNDFGRIDARQPDAVRDTGLTGANVVVGVIDSGIDWHHPAFRNPDGSTRIAAILDLAYPGDFDNDGELDGDPATGGGTVYTAQDINEALQLGNGMGWRTDEPQSIAPGVTTSFAIEVPAGTVPQSGVAVQIHLFHPDLETGLSLQLIGPDGTNYTPDWQSEGRGTYQATVPVIYEGAPLTGRDIGGTWQLQAADADAAGRGGVLWSWALHVDRRIHAEDLNGHGTHVAGTAAGGDRGRDEQATPYAGMAPGATLLFVRAERSLDGFEDDDLLAAMAWIAQSAEAMDMPWVTNMSLGGHYGPHDGSRPDEQAIDALVEAQAGAAIVVAAGNSGLENMHRSGGLGASAVPLQGVTPSGQPAVQAEVDIWYTSANTPVLRWSPPAGAGRRCISFRLESGALSDPREDCDRLDRFTLGDDIAWQVVRSDGGETVVETGGVLSWTGAQAGKGAVTVYMASPEGIIPGTWHLGLLDGGNGGWHAWQPGCAPLFDCDNRFTVGMPGTARGAITVAAHTTRVAWTDITGQSRGLAWWDGQRVDIGLIAPFSSIGPAGDGRAKPDISAPGLFIASAASGSAVPCPYGDLSYCDQPAAWIARMISEDTIISQGTSMAAPMVTGAVAMLLEDRPTDTAARLKQRLQDGARRDEHTGDPPDPNVWGAGKLDLSTVFNPGDRGGPCPVLGVEVSSTVGPGWEKARLIDAESTTVWSSQPHGDHLAGAEWAALVLAAPRPIDSVRIMPRPNFKDADHAEGFPKDFVIQYSFDGERRGRQLTCDPSDPRFREPANWVPVTTRNGYPQPGSRWQSFRVGAASARCVRILGTELSQDGFGYRYLQMAEMELISGSTTVPGATAYASSAAAHPMWMVANLTDGDPVTTWSSVPHGEHLAASEWVAVMLERPTLLNSILIHPRRNPNDVSAADGFPKDFVIQYAINGEHRGRQLTCDVADPRFAEAANWIPIATRTNFAQPRGDWLFIDIPPSTASCLRILATELSQDGFGNRYLQLNEILPLYDGEARPAYGAVAQSTIADARWSVSHVVDRDHETTWSSLPHTEHLAETEWAAVLFPSRLPVSGLRLYPRHTMPTEPAEGFPKDFIIQYAFNGPYRDRTLTCSPDDPDFSEAANWIPVANRVGFAQPADGAPLHFDFGRIVNADCVRLLATELSQDGFGLRYLQLAEVQPWRP